MRKHLVFFVLSFVLSFSSLPALAQSTFVVDRLTDTGEGSDLRGDLRYGITNAIAGDTITFEVEGTINLTNALPSLNVSVNIEGPGAHLLTVRRDTGAPSRYRIFRVGSEATVLISGLTIANGQTALNENGGGIFNAGTLTLNNSTVSGNRAARPHPGPFFVWRGGGIANEGRLMISNSTISGNYGESGGGGIFNQGELTVSSSTIASNLAPAGGGIYNSGTATVTGSTLSGNRARHTIYSVWGVGGAIYSSSAATATITNSTLWGNSAECVPFEEYECPSICAAGGIQNDGTLDIWNTICSDICGSVGSSGYNLIGVDPRVGPLEDNGGPTFTHALLPGSPAIDVGDNTDAPEWDQRGEGFLRIVNDRIDIGAFEFSMSTLSVSPTSIPAGETVTASWSNIPSPSATDWIGLFRPGDPNTAYRAWIYVSCSQTPGSPQASGSCPFVIPGIEPPDTLELRLLANDGFTGLATSNTFTVTGSVATIRRARR